MRALNTGRDWKKGGTRADAQTISTSEPAPTISGVPDQMQWTEERPATTLTGDPRVFPPGGHMANDGRDNSRMSPRSGWSTDRPATTLLGGNGNRIANPASHAVDENGDRRHSVLNAVRVTKEEAAVLQGFDPAYPWQGNRGQQFTQIGNAVPPPLARAILGSLLGDE